MTKQQHHILPTIVEEEQKREQGVGGFDSHFKIILKMHEEKKTVVGARIDMG